MKAKENIMAKIMFDPRDEDEQTINYNTNTMSDKLEKTGVVSEILPIQKGTSKAGKEYQKQDFAIDTNAEYNNIVSFGVFGEEKIKDLITPLKVGDTVTVHFNVSSNRWAPEGKPVRYFTSLDCWRIEKADEGAGQSDATGSDTDTSDLPF